MFHVTVVVALLAFVAYYLLYGRYVGTERDLSLKLALKKNKLEIVNVIISLRNMYNFKRTIRTLS